MGGSRKGGLTVHRKITVASELFYPGLDLKMPNLDKTLTNFGTSLKYILFSNTGYNVELGHLAFKCILIRGGVR